MYQAFLAIISLVAGAYCFWTKQVRMAFGFLIFAAAFFLLIPNLTFGIKTDIVGAVAMVLFVLGAILIAYKKREPKTEEPKSEPESNEQKFSSSLTHVSDKKSSVN